MMQRNVISLETSFAASTVLVIKNGQEAAFVRQEQPRGQSEQLVVLLQQAMEQAGLAWSDLNQILVGVGPGSFTGIRIALATAQGLAMAVGQDAVGMTTGQSMLGYLMMKKVWPAIPVASVVVVRSDQLLVQSFDEQGRAIDGPTAVSPDRLDVLGDLPVVTHDAEKLAQACPDLRNQVFHAVPDAQSQWFYACHAWEQGFDFVPALPQYVREADVTLSTDHRIVGR